MLAEGISASGCLGGLAMRHSSSLEIDRAGVCRGVTGEDSPLPVPRAATTDLNRLAETSS